MENWSLFMRKQSRHFGPHCWKKPMPSELLFGGTKTQTHSLNLIAIHVQGVPTSLE